MSSLSCICGVDTYYHLQQLGVKSETKLRLCVGRVRLWCGCMLYHAQQQSVILGPNSGSVLVVLFCGVIACIITAAERYSRSDSGFRCCGVGLSSGCMSLWRVTAWFLQGACSESLYTAQHSTAQHQASTGEQPRLHSTTGKAQRSRAEHGAAQHSTAQHSTSQHSTAQHSTGLSKVPGE